MAPSCQTYGRGQFPLLARHQPFESGRAGELRVEKLILRDQEGLILTPHSHHQETMKGPDIKVRSTRAEHGPSDLRQAFQSR
jgi:hypothetical protein